MRKHKYNAKPKIVDGIRFASTREAKRYAELKLLYRAGKINSLEVQPKYPLEVNGVKICTYIGDYRYFDHVGILHVEDVKGVITPIFKIKAKLMWACYKINVEVIP